MSEALLNKIDKNTNKTIELGEILDSLKPNWFLSKTENIKSLQNILQNEEKSGLLKSLESTLKTAYKLILLKPFKTPADNQIIKLHYTLIWEKNSQKNEEFDREKNLDWLNTKPSLDVWQRKQLNKVIEKNLKSILLNLKNGKRNLEDTKNAFKKSWTWYGQLCYLDLQNSSQEKHYFNEKELSVKWINWKTVYDILDGNEDAFVWYLNNRFKSLYDKEISSKSITTNNEK